MPACVLYSDEDMEPITVLDVPMWAIGRMRTGDRIRFVVPEPLAMYLPTDDEAVEFRPLKTVTIWAERFMRRGREHVMLFTWDDVDALKLDPTELPGQRAMAQDRYRRAFEAGFGAALLKMYRAGDWRPT